MAVKKFKTKFGSKEIVFEIGKMAGLASGSAIASYGDTVVLATAVVTTEPKEGTDFFPLLVDYEERLYAAGKISGSRFIKREGRPSEEAVLNCRLVDRPLRPLFPKDYRNDVQIVITVLSYDPDFEPDFLAINAASAALMQTMAPFSGPVGACRVAMIADKYILNPSNSQLKESQLDLVVAGNQEKVMMIELGAKEVSEEAVASAIAFGQKELQTIIKLQQELADSVEKPKVDSVIEDNPILAEVEKFLGKKLAAVAKEHDKAKREEMVSQFEAEVLKNFEGNYKQIDLQTAFGVLLEKEVRKAILEKDLRPDGRKLDEIRPITIETGLLPRTHGSALFTRGQTQVLSIVTLGGPGEEQVIETMEKEGKKRFMHHYNFPPFSTGEVSPMRSASRREIGHGALAERAILPMIPTKEEFPYTIRVVSEVLSSNGSSSMASTCGISLALMDAGVPVKKAVSGIAIGLVSDLNDQKNYKILTDIQGIEDFAGDMDFKVAGTKDGITAVQMDTKIPGLSEQIISDALIQAKKARTDILAKMTAAMPGPKPELSIYAPRVTLVKINPEKIRELIGPGGKVINGIIAESGGEEVTNIDIEDDGSVMISSTDAEAGQKAITAVKNITRELKPGEIFDGKVMRIMNFGAFVEVLPGHEGLVHISQLANYRVNKVEDIVKEGDKVKVKVVNIDDQGRLNLSMKAVAQGQKPAEEPKKF